MLMQHDGTLDNLPFRGTFYIHKIHPENNSFRKITNKDHNQKTSIITNIYPTTQVLLRLKFLDLFQN